MNYTEIVTARAKRFVPKDLNALSERQTQILDILAEGRTNPEIGKMLGISEKTVKNHLCDMFQKLGADNRTHAVMIAVRTGLIT